MQLCVIRQRITMNYWCHDDEVPCEMEGCLNLARDEQLRLKELPDKTIIKMEE